MSALTRCFPESILITTFLGLTATSMEQNLITVTKIKARWHARLTANGVLHSEMACAKREDIGYICRELSRWYDKCGGMSEEAHATRERMGKLTNATGPVGKIWHESYFLTKRTKN